MAMLDASSSQWQRLVHSITLPMLWTCGGDKSYFYQ